MPSAPAQQMPSPLRYPYRRRFRRTAAPSRAAALAEHLLDLIGEDIPANSS
jgi:hypothetical protein